MACYFPMKLYRSPSGPNDNGKWPLVAKANENAITVPCGRCIGCRLERSRQWAIRCINEASMHEKNAFITLTYNQDKIIYGKSTTGTLVLEDLQKFWKRLRKELGKNGTFIRYFACGEYGDTTNRPHYHACLFGFDWPDKVLYSVKNGNNLYSSDMLNNIWGNGNCYSGDVTFESAAYVARYIMKKHLGRDSDYYEKEGIAPEFVAMSRRPGIGTKWFEKYHSDVINNDIMVINGKETKPPKFYDKLTESLNPEQYHLNKNLRKFYKYKNRNLLSKKYLNSQSIKSYITRLQNEGYIRELIKNQKISRLVRNHDVL